MAFTANDLWALSLRTWKDKSKAMTAFAIAIAESGGNPRALNSRPPDLSYGLWQINMLGSLGPARRQQFGLASNEQLYDPATNARVAYALSNGGSTWRPWSVYKNRSYLLHMPLAAQLAGESVLAGAAGAAAEAANPIPEITSAVAPITEAFSRLTSANTWTRVGLVAGGFLSITLGIILYTGLSVVDVVRPIKKLTKTARKGAR